MRLVEVLRGDGYLVTGAAAATDLNITGVTCDSREVRPGYLFAAIPGTQTDGRRFIPDAILRGAVAVLGPPGTEPDNDHPDISVVTDEDPRRLYALMAARLFDRQPRTIVAITGTSGKTSTAHFLRQVWNSAGLMAGAMGTLGLQATAADDGNLLLGDDKALTTPDAANLHRQLSELTKLGVEHLAMEASSHGLHQRRLDGVRVSAAAFTNLSHDHLDYHENEAAYLKAKLRLFSDLLIDDGTAVINADQPYTEAIVAVCRERGLPVILSGEQGDRVRLIQRLPETSGQRLSVEIDGAIHQILLPLVGDFQASNALCAAALALATGTNAETIVTAIESLQGVPGRMQLIGENTSGGTIYVDYAHKPDALRRALLALRPHATGKLITVFGCGGDRDVEKRPEMGRIANELADDIYVTDDNPRGEDPAMIRRTILQACPDAIEIGDRRDAITQALARLGDGDILMVAGKGHETGQIVGGQVLPFDDAEVVRDVIGGGA